MYRNVVIDLPLRIALADGRFKDLLEKSKDLSPKERGELMQNEAEELISTHQELALEGQTEVRARFTLRSD